MAQAPSRNTEQSFNTMKVFNKDYIIPGQQDIYKTPPKQILPSQSERIQQFTYTFADQSRVSQHCSLAKMRVLNPVTSKEKEQWATRERGEQEGYRVDKGSDKTLLMGAQLYSRDTW